MQASIPNKKKKFYTVNLLFSGGKHNQSPDFSLKTGEGGDYDVFRSVMNAYN